MLLQDVGVQVSRSRSVLAGKVVVVAVISKPPSLLVSIAVVDSQHKGSTSAPTIGKL